MKRQGKNNITLDLRINPEWEKTLERVDRNLEKIADLLEENAQLLNAALRSASEIVQ